MAFLVLADLLAGLRTALAIFAERCDRHTGHFDAQLDQLPGMRELSAFFRVFISGPPKHGMVGFGIGIGIDFKSVPSGAKRLRLPADTPADQ